MSVAEIGMVPPSMNSMEFSQSSTMVNSAVSTNHSAQEHLPPPEHSMVWNRVVAKSLEIKDACRCPIQYSLLCCACLAHDIGTTVLCVPRLAACVGGILCFGNCFCKIDITGMACSSASIQENPWARRGEYCRPLCSIPENRDWWPYYTVVCTESSGSSDVVDNTVVFTDHHHHHVDVVTCHH